MARDKLLSSARALEHGIAIAPILAVAGRDLAGHPGAGPFACLRTEDDLARLARAWPARLFVKPAGASYGRGAMALTRDGAGWRDQDGGWRGLADLAAALTAPGEPMGRLVQPRLVNDAALAPIGGDYGLAATRVVTALTEDGPEVLLAVQKVLGRPAIADNFRAGFAGHLLAVADVATGRLTRVYGRRAGQRHLIARFDHHPGTGHPFAGFALPHWPDVLAQARAAARAFPELPLLGHDIAITPDGPRFLETNTYWKASLPQLAVGGLRPILRGLIPRLATTPEIKAKALRAIDLPART